MQQLQEQLQRHANGPHNALHGTRTPTPTGHANGNGNGNSNIDPAIQAQSSHSHSHTQTPEAAPALTNDQAQALASFASASGEAGGKSIAFFNSAGGTEQVNGNGHGYEERDVHHHHHHQQREKVNGTNSFSSGPVAPGSLAKGNGQEARDGDEDGGRFRAVNTR